MKNPQAVYIIRVDNSSANDIDNIVILDPAAQIPFAGTGNSYGNNPAIAITCPISNVTYPEILYEISKKPLTVDKLYVIGGRSAAIVPAPSPAILPIITMQPLSLVKYNAKGILETKTITPMRDPYQKIAAVSVYDKEFNLDDNSRIIIPRMFARSMIGYFIYIKMNTDISRLLTEQESMVAEFEEAEIIRSRKEFVIK